MHKVAHAVPCMRMIHSQQLVIYLISSSFRALLSLSQVVSRRPRLPCLPSAAAHLGPNHAVRLGVPALRRAAAPAVQPGRRPRPQAQCAAVTGCSDGGPGQVRHRGGGFPLNLDMGDSSFPSWHWLSLPSTLLLLCLLQGPLPRRRRCLHGAFAAAAAATCVAGRENFCCCALLGHYGAGHDAAAEAGPGAGAAGAGGRWVPAPTHQPIHGRGQLAGRRWVNPHLDYVRL